MSGDHLTKLNMSSSTATLSGINAGNKTFATASSTTLTNPTSFSITTNRYARLNVGGRLFSTSIDTLTKQDNMLRAMFSGRMELITDLDGYILIDRCGKHFELILNYLRDEDLNYNLDDKSEYELYEILKEVKFYCIQPLINLIEQKILNIKSMNVANEYYGSSIVSMVTSKNDLIKILNSTDKPCIRLLINRHNNKYSYTNNSDDNLLKNIELFERMAIKFKNRIMFIKDTASTEEICCWYFHGGGKKLSEVCCTSIVYTTEKKQTKVEFPDSKILEEIFVNAVLFESKETANNTENLNNQQNILYHSNGLATEDENSEEYLPPPRISLSAGSGGALSAMFSSNASATINNSNSNNTGLISSNVGSVNSSMNNATNIVGSTSSIIGIGVNGVINSNTNSSSNQNSINNTNLHSLSLSTNAINTSILNHNSNGTSNASRRSAR